MTNTFTDTTPNDSTVNGEDTVATASVSSPEVQEELKTKEPPKIPNNIYLQQPNEAERTVLLNENFNIFQISGMVNTLKSAVNPLHHMLKQKSKVFIFGAGGTTSWFLPKLLKIYNDAFHKVPSLRYDLQIVLIDADQV